jgi:ATPase subunit of ABC transporter with duplicated ATPase domains
MNLIVNNLSYVHSDKEILFQNISFSVSNGQKIALIGNNGTGKSTILKILAQKLEQNSGEIIFSEKPYYIPQHFGQFDNLSVAEALNIDQKIKSLNLILQGNISLENYNILNDDWNIEERTLQALAEWNLANISLDENMQNLSGGEKTKIFLAGINIHNPKIILLDEPTNHLDLSSRKQLYKFIQNCKSLILLVSHDRNLLNILDLTFELTKNGIEIFGGNYEFYKIQKENYLKNLTEKFSEKEKEIKNAKKIAKETIENQQKQNIRGKKQKIKEGMPRIMMKTLKNSGEKNEAKLKEIHSEKVANISEELKLIRNKLNENKELSFSFDNSKLHSGKILIEAKEINFSYNSSKKNENLWKENLNFQILSGDRIVIRGNNGSGKTTLLNLILENLEPKTGILKKTDFNHIYIDQEYSIIDNNLTIFEQIQQFNKRNLLEHELKIFLHHFLFQAEIWNKKCNILSGGEKMKLIFCCLIVSNNTPDVLILDEPTNNLDIRSLEIITNSIKNYRGTVVVISHDEYFINEIEVNKEIIV